MSAWGGSIVARLRSYGATERILGVDVARGLAVLGMFGAHVGVIEPFDFADPATWTGVVSGRSSILFALLAGVSIAILSGRTQPFRGDEQAHATTRILVRAAAVLLLGGLLEVLGTNVAVILMYYGVYFLLALPFLRWPPWALFMLATAVAAVMPFVLFGIGELFTHAGPDPVTDLLATGNYPALLWIAFVLVGMGIGRLELSQTRVRLWMLGAGVTLAALGYGLGEVADRAFKGELLDLIATTEPHSGSPFEVIGSTGFALAVLALCLLISTPLRWVILPLASVGSMALTAYTAQIVAIAVLQVPVPGETDNWAWLWFTIAALALCSLWFLLLGRGPLERALRWASRRVAGAPRPNTLENEN